MDGGDSVVGRLTEVVGVDEFLENLEERTGIYVRGEDVWFLSDFRGVGATPAVNATSTQVTCQ